MRSYVVDEASLSSRATYVLALLLLASPAWSQDAPAVRTLAGNGIAGNLDGAGSIAEFMEPVAVAVEAGTGAAVVADFAGQRIRRIASDGSVTTLAGGGDPLPSGLSVAGGYVDGPASSARFDGPSGIALAADGSIVVADTFNHCIRRIAKGVVSTIAGSPQKAGGRDGALASATFAEPRSVAVAAGGTIYVADYSVGVRKIDGNGVTTLPVPAEFAKNVTGLSLVEGAHPALFGAVRPGVWRYDLRTRAFATLTTSTRIPAAFAPFGVVALDVNRVVASSALLDALFLGTYPGYRGLKDSRSVQVAGGSEKDRNFVGGFADGVATQALFYDPLGLARTANGDILVADAGNRRIRVVPEATLASAEP